MSVCVCVCMDCGGGDGTVMVGVDWGCYGVVWGVFVGCGSGDGLG